MASARTRAWVLGVSVPAGPAIGIAAFVLVAAVFRSVVWPLGLVALLGAPACCCYVLGRRFGTPELGRSAAIVAAVSSFVTAAALLIYAFSQISWPVVL
jgi:hypothetical protein